MTANGLTPLAELSGQGLVLRLKRLGFEVEQPLVHQIEGVIDQLGRLVGGHDGQSRRLARF